MGSLEGKPYFEYLYRALLGTWLFLMLAFSGDFTVFKGAVLGCLILISITILIFDKPKVSLLYTSYFFIWIALTIGSYLYGIYNGFEFSTSLLLYMIITPIVCFSLSQCINASRINFLNNVLLCSTAVIIFISFYYIAYRVGVVSMPSWVYGLNIFGGSKIMDNKLEVRLSSQPSLIFLIPYLSTLLIFDAKCNKKLITLFLVLSFIVVIFSGRRALQILFFLGFFINIILYNFKFGLSLSAVVKVFIASIIFLLLLTVSFEIVSFFSGLNNPLLAFTSTIASSFDSDVGGGVQRYNQSIALWNYFQVSPVFGHGLNSHPEYLRNIYEKWSYEWVYLALLAQAGILYFLFTFTGFIILGYKLLSRFKKFNDQPSCFFGAILNGYICFLIAGATNPMFYFSWFWFLALIIFNNEYWCNDD